MEPTPYFTAPRLMSILTCLAAISVCGVAMTIMPSDRAAYAQLYADFKLKLPGLTELVIHTPDALVLAVLGVFAVTSVAAMGLFRSANRAMLLHFGVMAVTGITMAFWERALGQVFRTILWGMTGGSK